MFSWDKHKVSFEEAATVFVDPAGIDLDDAIHSVTEKRFLRLGRSVADRVLLIVYTLRIQTDGKETIRITSARQASRKERKAYEGF